MKEKMITKTILITKEHDALLKKMQKKMGDKWESEAAFIRALLNELISKSKKN